MGFNNGPKLVTTGLDLLVDAADPSSYPGSGTVWTDLRSGTTGSLTGSVAYTSEFYGGLTFTDSSSAVIFPGSTANYGTGSFTVEMAFKPDYIEGRHYLMSKNSGSFPNWAIYLSGSSGQGKLWSEFNIDASVSCSVSSSTTFETGSVYQVDVRVAPAFSASSIYVNGQSENGVFGNGGGSLNNTGSLLVGNYSQDNTQNFSGSIYTLKTYLQSNTLQPVINYNATSTRFSKQPGPNISKQFDYLVVAGGGGGSQTIGGGGGAGGLLTGTAYLDNFINQIIVGSGGAGNSDRDTNASNGTNSVLGSLIALGGGGASGNSPLTGSSGGSGGGSNSPGGYQSGIPGLGTPGQGNDGSGLGGGGGAGTAAISRDGGSGSYIASFAAIGGFPAGWFAGGGGGGAYSGISRGGIGGGGSGSISNAGQTAGITNTGGGGGSGFSGGPQPGGSGIVAIRYSGGPIAVGGEITQSAGYTYHVFRTVGTSSFTLF